MRRCAGGLGQLVPLVFIGYIIIFVNRIPSETNSPEPTAANIMTPVKKPPSDAHTALSPLVFWVVSVLVGIVAGFGAVIFRDMIGLFHNLFFLGRFSFAYDANEYTSAAPWGVWVFLVPPLGALGVAFLVQHFAPEAKGHGVPEVMDAVYSHKGAIRPVVALIKSVASALCIGSGGSVGREGPIVQIGSSFGSTLGQIMRVPSWQRITMIAAGAGGGIAATFNTPIGGILFAAELLLPEISSRTLIPVAISTATATYLSRWFLGTHPSFVIPRLKLVNAHPTNLLVLVACIGLGCLLGLVSTGFIMSIYAVEDFFERKVSGNYYLRHTLGMLIVGITMTILYIFYGHYYVEGVGYATIQAVLKNTMTALPLLALLFVLKSITTSTTLGSGGSGGIFSPSLFLGATFGAAYAILLKMVFPQLPLSASGFAAVGMAGVVGSTTGAAITSIVMIFEMTLDYRLILPITITVAIAYGIRRALCKDSIYTLKLTRRGSPVPSSLQANSWLIRHARDHMDHQLGIIPISATAGELRDLVHAPNPPHWLLVDDGGMLAGVLNATALTALIEHGGTPDLRQTASHDYQVVGDRITVFDLISRARTTQAGLFLVASQRRPLLTHNIEGVITSADINQAMMKSITTPLD